MSDQLAKTLNDRVLTHEEFVASCVLLADGHMVKDTWRNRDAAMYFVGISEEMGELAETIQGTHDDPAQLELMQIVACCINMHRKFYSTVVQP